MPKTPATALKTSLTAFTTGTNASRNVLTRLFTAFLNGSAFLYVFVSITPIAIKAVETNAIGLVSNAIAPPVPVMNGMTAANTVLSPAIAVDKRSTVAAPPANAFKAGKIGDKKSITALKPSPIALTIGVSIDPNVLTNEVTAPKALTTTGWKAPITLARLRTNAVRKLAADVEIPAVESCAIFCNDCKPPPPFLSKSINASWNCLTEIEPSDSPDFSSPDVIPICLASAFNAGPIPESIIEFHVSASTLPFENACESCVTAF